jgi:phosphoadenosine phosphosulfate reductase
MKFDIPDSLLTTFVAQAELKGQSPDLYIKSLIGQLHQRITMQSGFAVSLADKIATAEFILKEAFKIYPNSLAVAWTGGKDSTLLLWLIREMIQKKIIKAWPRIVFIDEGAVFDEVIQFVKELSKSWKFGYEDIKNEDVLSKISNLGDEVRISELNQRNRKELKRIGYKKKSWQFYPESMEGNHLMKTVTQNVYIEASKIQGLITGIRWDEQDARAEETYFSGRGDTDTPEHMRIHPILHFSEREIWEVTLGKGIPYCSLYAKGYRSLGAKGSTKKVSEIPAWEQDLDNSSERAGRAQDKEEIMKRLRDLGYM